MFLFNFILNFLFYIKNIYNIYKDDMIILVTQKLSLKKISFKFSIFFIDAFHHKKNAII